MPNYEYECTANGNRFEVWQEVGAAPPPCPECGAPTKKVFGVPRVIFKGSGFYVTDKRAEQTKSSSPTKSDAGKGDASGESSSGETAKSGSESSSSESATTPSNASGTGDSKTSNPPASSSPNTGSSNASS